MSGLTTHVLDLALGKPAAGLCVRAARVIDGTLHPLGKAVTNADGRTDSALVAAQDFLEGIYEISFHVGDYFARAGAQQPSERFLDIVPLRFTVSDAKAHYHVPLLVTPWSYSTYRGS